MDNFFGSEVRRYWRHDLAGFCLLMAISVLMRTVLFQGIKPALVVSMLVETVTMLVVLLLRPVFVRLRRSTSMALLIVVTPLLCVAAALLVTAWARTVTAAVGWSVPSWVGPQHWLLPWFYYIIVFATWAITYFWIAAEDDARQQQQRAAAAQAEALKAELAHLRQQLDPHFLFNALNGIASEITAQPQAAVAMVRELADYLRYSLDHRDETVSPFSADLDAVHSYLEVQKARFGPELRVRLTADESARGRQTPSFLLQPLVENAIKHALKTSVMPIDIVVEAVSDGTVLNISVANTGTLNPDWRTAGNPGVGLSVLRRRLALHYPDRHAFDIRQTGPTVTAALTLRGEPRFA